MSEQPYHAVWDFLHAEHGVTLLESDLLALVRMVRECDPELAAVEAEREVVEGIATASADKWECDRAAFEAEFRGWAQNICRHAIARIDAAKGGAS